MELEKAKDGLKDNLKVIRFSVMKNGERVSIEIDETLEGWAIVNEVGTGRWLGKVIEYDAAGRRAKLDPAFELSSPARIPVAVKSERGSVQGGVISGFDCDFVLQIDSIHPVEDIFVSSIQYTKNMSDSLRRWCFSILARVMLGTVGPDGKRRRDSQ